MYHGFNDTFAGTDIRLESVALLRIDSSQRITSCCLEMAFMKTANGLHMIPGHREAFYYALKARGTFLHAHTTIRRVLCLHITSGWMTGRK